MGAAGETTIETGPGGGARPRAGAGAGAWAAALGLLAVGFALLAEARGWREGALWLVGGALGFSLYHATFGFTGAYRRLLTDGRGAGVRAQALMLAVALVLFLPALGAGEILGQPVRGFVFPAGLDTVLGAFLFGIGMQIGGGCASGTLYTSGGGSTRMVATLAFFVAGATFAAWDAERWADLPSLPPVSLVGALGVAGALAVSLGALAAIWALSVRIERRRHGAVEPILGGGGGGARALLRGPWALAWGALALALLNFATLWLAGRPWGITAAFPLWGSALLDRLALADPAFWPYWEEPTRAGSLLAPLWTDRFTVMNLGLVLGACLAAGLAGRFRPEWRIPPRHLLASVVGGLMLGYGAVLGMGCNISAFFSGVASGSLHGWVWIAPALAGNWVGTRLRPAFGLPR
jgi:uncharacterized membrane protein YedE/YeeE